MGKYGYKFIGNAGFAAQFEAQESLSGKQEPISESSDKRGDGRPPMSDNCSQHQKKVSSTEDKIADCISSLAINLAKYKKKYVDRDK